MSCRPRNKVIAECAAAFAHTEMQATYDARKPDRTEATSGC